MKTTQYTKDSSVECYKLDTQKGEAEIENEQKLQAFFEQADSDLDSDLE